MHTAHRRSLATSICIFSCVLAASLGHAAATTAIYRCVEQDVVTYSDRPCGPSSTQYEAEEARISILEVEPPATVKRTKIDAKAVKDREHSIADAQAKRAEQCAKLERSLRDIRSKMRAGYDAKAGERLREQQRKRSAQYRELKC